MTPNATKEYKTFDVFKYCHITSFPKSAFGLSPWGFLSLSTTQQYGVGWQICQNHQHGSQSQ